MELGISTSYSYSLDLEENIRMAAKQGFDFISLGGKTSHSNYHKPDGRKRIKEILQTAKLRIDSIHAPFDPTCDLTQGEDIMLQSAITEVKRAISAASELEVRYVVVHLNFFRPGGLTDRIKRIQVSLPQVVKFAEENDVVIALENLDQESELLYKFALDLIDSNYLKVCYDNGHEMLYRDNFELLSKYADRLAVIHLHDNDSRSDLHKVPFTGKLDFNSLASQLNKLERIPPITLECEMRSSGYGTLETFLKDAFDNGKRFIKMLKRTA